MGAEYFKTMLKKWSARGHQGVTRGSPWGQPGVTRGQPGVSQGSPGGQPGVTRKSTDNEGSLVYFHQTGCLYCYKNKTRRR